MGEIYELRRYKCCIAHGRCARQRVREAARKASILIILTNVAYHPSAIDGGRIYEKAKPLRYFVKGNAMGDRHDGPDEASLFDLEAKYADVVSKTDITAHLRSL
ncbi:hypothetical protein [Erythrobacter sp. Alg231-14]|uniref:hypothetical protein n=1 Tax=Erythrobacter sp. Alg231-14 TaxID=1922225 RepID=UPI000D55E4EF